MRLAIIDSRQNKIVATQRAGSDPLPSDAYEQYVIDMDRIPKTGNPVVPAWVVIVRGSGDITPTPGVLQLPGKFVIGPVVPQLQLWCKAGLILARSQFGKALEQGRVEANARIKYWLEGGRIDSKGWVDGKLDVDDLPMRILQQWPFWQTDAFKMSVKSKKLKLWSARLETIKQSGYALALNENRLKVTYQRMEFRVNKKLQKSEKL